MLDFWVQKYDSVAGSNLITSIVDIVPIVYFLLALVVFKMKGHIASLTTLVLAAVIAITLNGLPVTATGSAALFGVLAGLWPIGWIVLWAIFIYNITVKSGQFEVIRNFIGNVSDDVRVQVLLIAVGFGSFLEGVAGFGIPIAIGASLLIGCGMKDPIKAIAVCLIANMIPAPAGAIGIPITVNSAVTGIDASQINFFIGRHVSVIGFIVPFWLVAMVDGFKGIKQVLPMILLVSILSVLSVFLSYKFIGHELADIVIGVVIMLGVVIFSKIWKPTTLLTSEGYVSREEWEAKKQQNKASGEVASYSDARTLLAWSPFIVISITCLVWTIPSFKALLDSVTIKWQIPGLHGLIFKGEELLPGVTEHVANGTLSDITDKAEKAVWSFDILKSVGTALAVAALYSVFAFRCKLSLVVETFVGTVKQVSSPILTICFVLGFAKIADYSGQTAGIALLLTNTGSAFPFLGPILGMLGVYLTGSVVNSNTLFAKVQTITASNLGFNPALMAASNNIAAVTGKVISPLSVAIGCAATKNVGREGEVLGSVLLHALIFLVFCVVMTALEAYLFTVHF